MDTKQLQRMKRGELLELMLAQGRELDRLRERVADLEAQVAEKDVAIATSGSLAEASLKLTHVFEEAQRAADIYLHDVRRMADGSASATPTVRARHFAPAADDPRGGEHRG